MLDSGEPRKSFVSRALSISAVTANFLGVYIVLPETYETDFEITLHSFRSKADLVANHRWSQETQTIALTIGLSAHW